MRKHDEHADVPVPPPVLFGVPWLITVLALRRRPPVPMPRWARRSVGGALTLAGVGLGGWSIWELARAKENPDVSSPTHSVIRTGPYALTRNPIYLGMAFVYAGMGLMADSLATVVSLPLVTKVVESLAVRREEAYLRAKFGREYERYCEEVPRWR